MTAAVIRVQLPPRVAKGRATAVEPSRRPAYVASLLAFGHELRRLLDSGAVSGVGELARRLGVSQPRVTQILNLTYLAPEIQGQVLSLVAVDGVEPMTERPLRKVLAEVGWGGQRRVFDLVVGAGT